MVKYFVVVSFPHFPSLSFIDEKPQRQKVFSCPKQVVLGKKITIVYCGGKLTSLVKRGPLLSKVLLP